MASPSVQKWDTHPLYHLQQQRLCFGCPMYEGVSLCLYVWNIYMLGYWIVTTDDGTQFSLLHRYILYNLYATSAFLRMPNVLCGW